jgi:hypothetical protein
MARANDTGTTIILFTRAHARPMPKHPHNLVRVLDEAGDVVALSLRVDKEALRSIATRVIEEDDTSMLLSLNVDKDTLRRYSHLFAVLLSFAEAR